MTATGLLLETTLKTSIVVLIALAAASLLRRQSAAVRHCVLASAMLCSALVPVLGPLVPSWHLPIAAASVPAGWIESPAAFRTAQDGRREGAAGERTRYLAGRSEDRSLPSSVWPGTTPLSRTIATLWLTGAAISLLVLCAGLGRLAWIASRARRLVAGRWPESAAEIARAYRLRSRVQLLQSGHPTLLVTYGAIRPAIILPRSAQNWSDDRIGVVLAHELAHVKRRDWAMQIVAEIVRAIYWFNPLVWLLCRHLRHESEHATDDAVLNCGVSGSDYAAHLLDLARVLTSGNRRTWLPAPAIARPSSFERRVHAMLNERINRAPTTRPARVITFAAVSCLTVALAAAQGSFSTFSGTVLDTTNSFIPGATLILTNPQNRAKYEVVSDPTGHFEFLGLPPGEYQLETRLPGFAALRGTVTLRGQDAQRDLVLELGTVQETIVVKGGPAGTGLVHDRLIGPGRPARHPDPVCEAPAAGGVGGNIRAPRKLLDVKPIYPSQLSEANVGGAVVLQARINTEGTVDTVEVVSPAHPDLNAAAIEAVRQWEFDPTILNCSKVDVALKVTVTFVPR